MEITITLNQEEILGSICNFLRDKNVVTDDKNIEINLVAGRGANGHSAVVSIKDGDTKGAGAVLSAAKQDVIAEPDVAPPQQRRTRTTKAQTETTPPTPPVIPEPPVEELTPASPEVVPTEEMLADEMTSSFNENEVTDNLFANSEEATELFTESGEQPQAVESLFS